MGNKEKLMNLVSQREAGSLARNKERIRNRERIRESQKIALKVLVRLDEMNWSQKRLAEEMGVSPQQVNKIVKGKENLTLETQIKLQNILHIPILASFYEDEMYSSKNEVVYKDSFDIGSCQEVVTYQGDMQKGNPLVINMQYHALRNKYSFDKAAG